MEEKRHDFALTTCSGCHSYDELARRVALLEAFPARGYPGPDSVCAAPPAAATSMQEEMLRK